MRRRAALIPFVIIGLLLCPRPAPAQVPPLLNHEGLVLEDDGTPMEGQVDLRFAIYDRAVGGAPMWFEEVQLQLVDGYYRVLLGVHSSLEGILVGGERYLGIAVDGGDELFPRNRLVSVPYALLAGDVEGDIHPRSIWIDGREIIDDSGNWVGPPVPGAGGDGFETAEELLAALLTVDGEGSGVDADQLDGLEASDFVRGAEQVRDLLRDVDGDGSGIDADRLDGLDSTAFVRTPDQVLGLLTSVDGDGSGLDADRLDGLDSTAFARSPEDVLDRLVQVDGQGSGVDADRLDGLDSSQFLRAEPDLVIGGGLELGEGLTATGRLSTDSTVQLGGDGVACSAASDAGQLRYNSGSRKIEYCDGASWKELGSGGGGAGGDPGDGTTRQTAGGSCRTIKADGLAQGDGVYWIDPNRGDTADAFQAYCDMTLDGGGWTLLFNLASRDNERHHYNDDAFWLGNLPEGSVDLAMVTGFKSLAYSRFSGFSEVMVVTHDAGAVSGWASYPVMPGYDIRTFHWLMNNVQDARLTGTKRRGDGTVGTTANPNRDQSRSGDIFIDHAHPIVLNRTSGWAAQDNYNRVATTLTNNDYGHTFAGMGGYHRNGSWQERYETAPISPYCCMTNGYGSEGRYLSGNIVDIGGDFPHRASCRGPVESEIYEWLPIDTAFFIREEDPEANPPADGQTPARASSSCKAIRDDGLSRGDGVYWLDPDGGGPTAPFETICDMSTDGGGWTLLFNLSSRDDVIRHWDDGWWTQAAADGRFDPAMEQGFKTEAWAAMPGFQELMIQHHDRGALRGWASYSMLGAYQNRSWQWLMANSNNTTVTGNRARAGGSVGTTRNPNRPQSQHGDIFLDNGQPVVLNRTSGWASNENYNRVATTLTNNEYGHTFAGLGGRHRHGSWGTRYENAPISPYCSLTNGYGEQSSYTRGAAVLYQSDFPFRDDCRGPREGTVYNWLPVDAAVLVR